MGAGDGGDSGPASRHPTDRLIRELIATGRVATSEEVAAVVECMATAPFDPRTRSVRLRERGISYQGRDIGAREESLFFHLAKRVVTEEQWRDGAPAAEYLADLRRGIRAPTARLVVYTDRGGVIAATITPTVAAVPEARLGAQAHLLVIYSADRGIMVTGYQFSTLDKTRIPPEAVWLR